MTGLFYVGVFMYWFFSGIELARRGMELQYISSRHKFLDMNVVRVSCKSVLRDFWIF